MTSALDLSWHLVVTEAGRFALPSEVSGDRLPASAPGTAAGALAEAGLWSPGTPLKLHDKDVWYRATVPATGRFTLDLAGLATIAEVYLGDTCLLTSRNAYRRHRLPLDLAAGDSLSIAFRALAPHLQVKGPRARWRVPMIPEQGLRLVRTPLIGHMPGWTPPVDIVGPFRACTLLPQAPFEIVSCTTRMDGSTGHVQIVIRLINDEAATFHCGKFKEKLAQNGDIYSANISIPDAPLWWPHTHGPQPLLPLALTVGDTRIDIGHAGFRTIESNSESGFGLTVNGEAVFCRGAVWTEADPIGLGASRAVYEPFLVKAREAGMNMIRVGGTMIPPGRAFYEVCDELGLMVWQEFPFANFDYPIADPDFRAEVEAESADLLSTIGTAPSLTVLCGGSEAAQQAAMMGLPSDRWPGPLYDEVLPAIAARHRPDVPYVPNSPSGGPLPFLPNAGVGHYYGVGAYKRPLEDARRAAVGFAAECLAFSNIPEADHLDRHLPGVPPHDPRWKATVPRDLSASWDFEDVREHYLREVFKVDPDRLRRENLALWLDLGRLVTGHVMAETFAEWRRAAAPTQGALVWTLMDLAPGAGWGLIDSDGTPKPAWHLVRRALQPVQVLLTDEGTNGLSVHLINETADAIAARLELLCLKDGRTPIIRRSHEIELAPRSNVERSAYDLIGAFFDITYAYRFGPPGHDVTVVRLVDATTGTPLSEAFHHPLGLDHNRLQPDVRVTCDIGEVCDMYTEVVLHADAYVPWVHATFPRHSCRHNWLPLVPGHPHRLRLEGTGPVSGTIALPGGRILATLGG
ncbi:glycosyl hydrolase 2 galactose-binding domain-containing protein [Oryzibacter oryziterrae]|uniref:glycosyl hydrolase 2 galactose-binding domain-containing protein n=1 Tax=Oryzibacter oryziterrae TaxID=2766474 RepID=UPI001F30B26E|nr:glycoside hydrolase family 2 protein [Oryzibacter oryziterrae]